MALINGEPCLALHSGGELDTVVSSRIASGKVTELYAVRNPDKLSRLQAVVPLSRN